MKKLLMALVLMPVMALADTETVDGVTWTYKVIGGKAQVGTGVYGSLAISSATVGAITIPSTLGNCPVTSIGVSAFEGCSGLTSVTIPSSVTSIGVGAFYDCSGLTSVTIPSSVTSIGRAAFSDCSGLTSVTIPSSVTSIGNYAFSGCSGLKSVTISEGVTNIWDGAFSRCSGLTSVTIPSSVTSIGDEAFYFCSGLTSVTIPSSVKSIGKTAFKHCSGLTSVMIPSSVTSIGEGAFSYCRGLEKIYVSVGDVERVKAMINNSHSDISVDSLTFIEMLADGGLYTETVDGVEWTYTINYGKAQVGMGDYSSAIPSTTVGAITIPSTLGNCPVTSIGDYAFYGCSGLKSVTIPSSVTSIGEGAFSYCRGLEKVYVSAGDVERVKAMINNSHSDISVDSLTFIEMLADGGPYTETVDGVEWTYTINYGKAQVGTGVYGSLAISSATVGAITIPSTLGNCPVTSIGESAFYKCSGLTSITIPSSVTSIGGRAFYECSGLTSVTIPSSVTSIGDYAFYGCSGLKSVTIPSSVTSIGTAAFYKCSGLTSITIPSSVTSIGGRAFSYCSGLMSFGVNSANMAYCSLNGLLCSKDGKTLIAGVNGDVTIPSSVTSIGDYAFYGCSGLTSVTIPSSVTSIGDYAFSYCSRLTSVKIPKGVTSIGDYAFCGCVGLTSVTMPSSVTSIGIYAFYGCSGLTSVTISEGVTSIGEGAFSYCRGLTSVTIPSSVTSIGHSAFSRCSGLEKIYVSVGDVERVKAMINNSHSDISVDSLTFIEMLADGGPYTETVDGVEWTFCVENGNAKVGSGKSGFSAVPPETVGALVMPLTLGGCPVTGIGDAAFYECRDLTSVTIPEGVTSIGESAFENCRHLESITIPATVKKIDAYAFYGCGHLKTVNYLGEVPEIEDTAFAGTGVGQSPSANVVNVVVSNVVVQYVLNSVQPQFALPVSSDTGFVNIITEVKGNNVAIPATWANEYPNFVSKFGTDFTKALAMQTGKKDGAGNPMLVWQDYVAGTDPTKEDDVFTASITIVDGKVTISYTPELDDARKAMRKYTTWGKKSLMDTSWAEVPEGHEAEYNFFKVSVEMR